MMETKFTLCVILCIAGLLCSCMAAKDPASQAGKQAAQSDHEYLVGIYYFAGWWSESPNKYHTDGHDWTKDYPGRIPILGRYVDQQTMDREIVAAASHGVDFFQILWYPQLNAGKLEPHAGKLNDGVRYFMASKNHHLMKFTVEYVNHPPFTIDSDKNWESACRHWCQIMKHPSYLRVDGRPVFKIHGARHFLNQNGGNPSRVSARIETLRRIARESGLPNPLVSAGIVPADPLPESYTQPYDFLTTYMDMPHLTKSETPYPYAELLKYAEEEWRRQATQSTKTYVPYVPSGWDPRPWRDPRPSFAAPSREEWMGALRKVKAELDASSSLGIPGSDGKRQKALLIYAWNEYGEGGFVAPTKEECYMKLEGIQSVFGAPDAKTKRDGTQSERRCPIFSGK